jgi:alcohol dehydrogenase class IV
MKMEFGTSRRVIFGRGELARVGEAAAAYGRRAVMITGRSSGASTGAQGRIHEQLSRAGIEHRTIFNEGEPTIRGVDRLTAEARDFRPDLILGLGGGSAMDAAKAVAAMLTNAAGPSSSVLDFLDGVGSGVKITKPTLPVIAIPTTAGTGAEATKNAVIRSDDRSFKKSLRSPLIRPTAALVDPTLTQTMPAGLTASCGADALTQLLEAFTSRRANLFTNGWAREGLALVAWALERAYLNPQDEQAREAMAMASLLGGLALDNAGLGAVHGLASPIGGFFEVPHGVVCGNLLPEITEVNIRAARRRAREDEGAHQALVAYRRAACLFNGGFDCEAEELVEFLHAQREAMMIPHLRGFKVKEEDIPRIVGGCRGGSMNTNPVDLTDEEITQALRQALQVS